MLRTALLVLSCTAALAKVAPSSASAASAASFVRRGAVVSALEKASAAVSAYEAAVTQGEVVEDLGAKFETIAADAMRQCVSFSWRGLLKHRQHDGRFDSTATVGDDDLRATLERAVDARLELVYAKQLRLLREEALKEARTGTYPSEYEALCAVDTDFRTAAKASARPGSLWDSALERTSLATTLMDLAIQKKRSTDAQLVAARQQANYMSLFKAYSVQIQQLQQAQYGSSPPLQIGFNYRATGSDINLSGGYQQGKASLQLACVDNESIIGGDLQQLITVPSDGNVGLSLNV